MLQKIFLKKMLKNYKGGDFSVIFWDKEEIRIGKGEPKFTIEIKAPLPFKYNKEKKASQKNATPLSSVKY